MLKTNKLLSVLLSAMLMLACFAPVVSAAEGYTQQNLDDNFTRLLLTDQAFAAETARTFTVTIPADGNYAVFLQKAETANTNFVASFSNGTDTYSLCSGTSANSAYAYTYVRLGASSTEPSAAVSLTKGEWTLTIQAATAITVSYIDIRSTIVQIDGSKQAIYPSDFDSIEDAVGIANYVNSDMNKNSYPRISGYDYYGDYTNSSLASPWSYGRGIHIRYGKTATYKLNVAKAGAYIIKMNVNYYTSAAVTEDSEIPTIVTATGNPSTAFTHTFAAGTASGTKSSMLSKAYNVTLAEGANEITLKPDSSFADMYLWSFTIEPTAAYIADGFSRIVTTDGTFEAGAAREFDVEIKQDGDYAVFLQKEETDNTNFIVTFTKDGETKTLWNRTSLNSSYAYNYVRVGGEGGQTSVSVPLTTGVWTMSITAATAMTVSYIDIRTTTIPIDGTKQAIYPSDYNISVVDAVNYINGQISKSEYPRVSDYTYYADYTNPNLAAPFTYGRGIHVASGTSTTYKLHVANAGGYKIKLSGTFRNNASVAAGTVAKAEVAIDGNEAAYAAYTYASDTSTGAKLAWNMDYIVTLAAGENVLSLSPDEVAGAYILSFTIESYDPDKENTVVLAKDEVASYMAAARKAYVTDAYADYTTSIIQNYVIGSSAKSDVPKPVTLSWDAISGAESYTLLISETADFSGDVITIENITETSYDVYNLYVDTIYYWKVLGAETESEVGKFYTDDTVRYIYVDGARNVRDLGGWNGLNQGWAFRGSELDLVDNHGLELTEAGRKVLHDDLGIKTDLDFRTTDLTESPIGSDVVFNNDYKIGNYTNAFSSSLWTGVMKTFADIDNYPIYFHCWGGADRTGTVAFLLEALCGAAEEDLAIDFELTSFAIFGTRPRYDTTSYKYASTIAKLKEYQGATLQEKAENYALTTLGLTRTEISNIQSILSGNAVVFERNVSAAVGRKTKIPLKNLGGHTVSAVTVNGEAVEFSLSENILTVKATEAGEGIITFEDGNSLTFAAEEVSACDTWVLSDGFTRLLMTDTDFIAGETYKYPVTVAEDGEYAVFLNKEGTESNNFKVTFEQNETVIPVANGGSASSAYGYNYVRAGAGGKETPVSAALTAGDWVVCITPAADATVTYIDIRSSVLPISGAAQAIYPSDFNTYTPDVSSNGHVNGQISKSLAKASGYSYIGDYANEALDAPFAGDRQIHFDAGRTVTYKLNVQQAGTYRITYNHYFYLYLGDAEDAAVDAVLTVTAGSNEAQTKTHTYAAGETGKTDAGNTTIEVPLAAGEQTLTFASAAAGSYLCHLTIEKQASTYNDKVVSVDNTLTRIEADSANRTISAGAARSFDFTVPANGSYNFYAHIGNQAMDMEVTLKNLDTQELTTIFSGTLSVINPVYVRRLGMGPTAPVALAANTSYRLYVTPSVSIAVPFVDVMNVNLPIGGKTAVSPQYYSATDITDAQINCGDQSNKVTPESGYTLAGNFLSSSLAAQSGFNTGYAITPHISNGRSLTYTLNVTKAGVYQISADAGSYASTYTDSEVLEFLVDDAAAAAAAYTKTDRSVERLTGPAVYLTEGTHTLTLNNPTGGNAGFYLHQLLFTPVKGMGAEIADGKATVCAYLGESYTGAAMIALYSGSKELIGLANISLTNGDYASADITLSGTPAAAKVFIWDDLDSVTPLTENIEVTSEDPNWKVIS